jgi:hypothetical protein
MRDEDPSRNVVSKPSVPAWQAGCHGCGAERVIDTLIAAPDGIPPDALIARVKNALEDTLLHEKVAKALRERADAESASLFADFCAGRGAALRACSGNVFV